ncbi:MAG TPA: hypothetical protein VNN25_14730 [Thermoanaerobaculia bacterium]|nr:hypothetical protein [Thermoanaerobaculia bacterium]
MADSEYTVGAAESRRPCLLPAGVLARRGFSKWGYNSTRVPLQARR